MKFKKTKIEKLLLISHDLFSDNRGVFRRSFCINEFKNIGVNFQVKQGNISENMKKHTLRGFHYQKGKSKESKVITCIKGHIYNVVVDLRPKSKTYKDFEIFNLNEKNKHSLHVPEGCANAFLTLENNTIVHYYMSDFFKPSSYSGFRFNDPAFNINWPFYPKYISERDKNFSNYSNE